jgi:GTP cyclohydrolase I
MSVDRLAAERAIEAFLRAIGRDPDLEPELRGTAARVTAAYVDELCEGYAKDPSSVVRPHLVPHPGAGSTAVVALREVTVTTMCPHHLMPASGVGTIAYAPRDKLVGLGVMAELLDVLAHRLTLQEEIGERVAEVLAVELGARWVACRLVLHHACVSARGERKHGAVAETVAFVGDARDRSEALALVGERA